MRARIISALRVACAVALTCGIAALVSVIFQSGEIEFRAKLPFIFLVLIIVIAKRLGEAAAILSTIAAALVFALLLFQPLGSFGVVAKTARSSLAWFLLGGMVCAHLLSPAKRPLVRRTQFSREDD